MLNPLRAAARTHLVEDAQGILRGLIDHADDVAATRGAGFHAGSYAFPDRVGPSRFPADFAEGYRKAVQDVTAKLDAIRPVNGREQALAMTGLESDLTDVTTHRRWEENIGSSVHEVVEDYVGTGDRRPSIEQDTAWVAGINHGQNDALGRIEELNKKAGSWKLTGRRSPGSYPPPPDTY